MLSIRNPYWEKSNKDIFIARYRYILTYLQKLFCSGSAFSAVMCPNHILYLYPYRSMSSTSSVISFSAFFSSNLPFSSVTSGLIKLLFPLASQSNSFMSFLIFSLLFFKLQYSLQFSNFIFMPPCF